MKRPLGSLLLWAFTLPVILAGCALPARQPIWLPDSSAVVVRGQCYVLATRRLFDVDDQCLDVDPRTGRVTRAEIKWDEQDPPTAELTLTTARTLLERPGPPVTFSLRFPPEFAQHWALESELSFLGLEIHSASQESRVLVCTGTFTWIVDLETRKVISLPHITPPVGFSRIFGTSPCRPDGQGFLALRKRTDLSTATTTPKSEKARPPGDKLPVIKTLRRSHDAMVFVGWDGSVSPLEGWDALPDEIPALEQVVDFKFMSARRFPGTCNWKEDVAVIQCLGMSLELDTATRAIRYQSSPSEILENVTLPLAQEMIGRRVELDDGATVIHSRLRPPRSESDSIFDGPLEVVLERRSESGERILDVSRNSGCVFQFYPSPDGKWLLIVLERMEKPQQSKYSVLLDSNGDYVTSFGISERQWREHALEATIGLPEGVMNPQFGSGYLLREGHCTAQTIDFMLRSEGRFAEMRNVQFLSLGLSGGNSALLPGGLSRLAAFPRLKALQLDSPELVSTLSDVPQVTGLSIALSDDQLERLKAVEQITSLELHRPAPKKVNGDNGYEEIELLTASGLRHLDKFPNVKVLSLNLPSADRQPRTTLPALSKLQELQVHFKESSPYDPIGSGVLEHLDTLPSLSSLTLGGSTITGPTLEALSLATGLESLTLDGPLELPESPVFSGLTKLKRLDLSVGNSVSQKLVDSIGTLQGLESLKLSGGSIDSLHLEPLKSLASLRHLDLSIRKASINEMHPPPIVYSHLGISPLKHLTTLETINLTFIEIDSQELMELRSLTKLRQAEFGKAINPHAALKELSQAIPKARLAIYYPINGTVSSAHFKGGRKLDLR